MKWRLVSAFVLVVPLLLLVFPCSGDVEYYSTKGQCFTFPAYGTGIGFDEDKTFSTLYRENSQWYFNNYWFSVQNANLTVTTFFESDLLQFSLDGSESQSTTNIFVYDKGEPSSVDGAIQDWDYNPTTEILTIYAVQSPSVAVEWTETPATGGSTREDNGGTFVLPTGRDVLPYVGLLMVAGGLALFGTTAFYKKATRKIGGSSRKAIRKQPFKPRKKPKRRG